MKIIKRILLVVVALIGLMAVIGFFLPSNVHVERSLAMKASPEKVFNYISNLHHFNEWSPWHKLDSTAQYTFEGPESGVGASFSWKSNNSNVGSGKQIIIEAIPNEKVKMELYFMDNDKPAFGTYAIKKEGEGINFTWSIDADMGMNPFMRWMGLMMGMVGKMFDQGLADLKPIVENMP